MKKDVKPFVEPEVEAVKDNYRYFCDACTNIAFYSTIPVNGESRTCQQCGKVFTTKKENYIKI